MRVSDSEFQPSLVVDLMGVAVSSPRVASLVQRGALMALVAISSEAEV